MLISTTCPDCQSKLHIPAQRAGQTIPCPKCGREITLAPAPPPIPSHCQPPLLPPRVEEKIQPSGIEAEILQPQGSEPGLPRKRQLWVGILAAFGTFVLVIGGLWAFGLLPRHSSKSETLETQARQALIKALESWRFGDKVTKIRKENIYFYDYDRIFCNAKLVRFEIGTIRNQNDAFEIATQVILEGRKRNEIKESKVYLVKPVDDRWQIVALNDDSQEKLNDWLETMKTRAEAIFPEIGGEEEPGRKTAVEEKYQDLVAAKKTDLQDLNREEDDPVIKKLLQKWILPIADIESPTAKKQPAYWVKALAEGEPKWSKAVGVLVGMGEMAVGELSAGLKARDSLVRWGSATALGEIGPPAGRKALASLIEALGDANEQVEKATQIALNNIGPPTREEIPTYLRILNHPKESVRRHALTTLANLNVEMPELIPVVIEALKDSAKAVRILAAQCLGNIGSSAKEVTFAPLFAALKDADLEVRHEVSEALKKIGPPAPAEVPTLAAGLKDPTEEVRQYALFALEQLGPQAAAAVPVLQSALRDGDGNVRGLAASALGEIGLPAKTAIPALVEALKDSVPQVRAKAAAALGKMGDEARLALPMLDQTLKDRDREVRLQTVKALSRIGPVSILLQGLIDTWEENDPELNQAAETALIKMGVLGDNAVPILRKALGSSKIPVRLYAAKTLGDMGPAAREAIPELNNALKDTDMGVRLQVTLALSKIGSGTGSANPLVPALLD
ncbi:MAG TPA: HEAT repeat domain-containing protein, partial [Gemmataceae bacterium]|nr:HEAT repeat domain-containing protein [Gemmataceae bacterium]